MRILHAGCGQETELPKWLSQLGFPDEMEQVRLDIDPGHNPDIVATIDNLGDIGPFDGIFCCHTLEHLHIYNATQALRAFLRVLRPGGVAIVEVPNLAKVKPTRDVVYETPEGLKITGFDMYFGYRDFAHGNDYMLHRSGFIPDTMKEIMEFVGFKAWTLESGYDLLGIGVKECE